MNYKMIMNKMMMIPIPLSINYMWNMGSLMMLNLSIQFLSGIMLVMYYSTENSFNSIIFIMRETNYGWVMRLIHMNMASFYFLIMYLHIGRSMFYNSFNKKTWNIGVLILLISTMTAFLGYTLPWGQMSYWAATVITNLITSLPYFKMMIVEWIWGNFSVNKLTLTRFFCLHFLMPFVILILVVFHIMTLHLTGSSNPLGLMKNNDKINFNPYFLWKDYLGFMVMFMLFMMIMTIKPFILSNPENMLMSNPMITPLHIEPEWYFLYAYSILRSISSKMGGTMMMLMSIMIMFMVPMLYKNIINNSKFYPINKLLTYSFFINFMNLTMMGMMEMKHMFMMMSKIFTIFYFIYFFMNYLMFKIWNYLIY